MAEREGFEPPMELPPCRISSAVHSTTLPPLREVVCHPKEDGAGRHGPVYAIAIHGLQHPPWQYDDIRFPPPVTHPPLFFYGTLRDPDIRAAALGRQAPAADLAQATAPGYAAVYYPHQVYPALVPRPEAVAPGLVLMHASDDDRAALDGFEGADYSRALIIVDCEGKTMLAEAYYPVVSIAADSPGWSLEIWTRHHKPAVIGSETAEALRVRTRLLAERG